MDRVLWEGDKYRAVVVSVNRTRVLADVERCSADNQTWNKVEILNALLTGYERKHAVRGYRDPHRWWWFDRTSINEAVMRVVEKAQQLERQYQEAQRQTEQTRHKVEAAAEVQEIASAL